MDTPSNPQIGNTQPTQVVPSTPTLTPASDSPRKEKIQAFLKTVLRFLPVIIIIAVIGVVGYLALNRFVINKPEVIEVPPPPQVQPIQPAKVTLKTSPAGSALGQPVDIEIWVDTGGYPTQSADIVLKYDPLAFEPLATSSATYFKKGKIYPDISFVDLNTQEGLFEVSGIVGPGGEGFNGIGMMGALRLKAKKAGTTQVTMEFDKNSTRVSNVLQSGSGENILTAAQPLQLTIK